MRPIAILTYHSLDASGSVVSVTPNVFAGQMASIAELGYRGIALRDAVTHREAHGSWPDTSVVLTFDDGYRNFCEHGLPVLVRNGFTATLFLASGHVGGENDWADPPPLLGKLPLLSWNQARDLSAAGIEIGAHSKRHPDLRQLSPLEVEREIVGSRDEIANRIGSPVETFAYPFGCVGNAARQIVRRTFRAACTTVLRRAAGEPLHELPRVDMYYIRSRVSVEKLLNGQLDPYLTTRRWGRLIRQLF
ncbi:MAG: polysaccharide deacetylase family protein [Candidatus Binatia bacterium]